MKVTEKTNIITLYYYVSYLGGFADFAYFTHVHKKKGVDDRRHNHH